jgi:hypothetical protein
MEVTIPWMAIERKRSTESGKTNYLEKTFSISTTSITHPTRTALGLNTGHRDENLLTDLYVISLPLADEYHFHGGEGS